MFHLGYGNPKKEYFFGENLIPPVHSIQDLGITLSDNLKFHEHINKITSSANITANLIHKCFQTKTKSFMIKMFNTFVRPKIEYASQVWNPQYIMDIDKLEKVQRKFTKRLPTFSYLSYPNRMDQLNICSLELRRLHLDLVYMYKLMKGLLNVSYENFFELKNTATRGHSLTVKKSKFRLDVRKHFFSNTVINSWNYLPEPVISAQTVPIFKKLLHTVDLSKFLKGGGLDVRN